MLRSREITRARADLLAHRGMLLRMQAQTALRRFVHLYRKYDDNQPRDDHGRWTDAGGEEPATTGTTTQAFNQAYTGDSRIDAISDKLLEKAAEVSDELGPGSGPQYGTSFHTLFAEKVRDLGIVGMQVEQSHLEGSIAAYGTPESVRTDVILRDYTYDPGSVVAIWDLKTGSASLTPSRAAQLRYQSGASNSTPVLEMHLVRGFSLKARPSPSIAMSASGSQVYVTSTHRFNRDEWQRAIDRQNFIVKLVLEPAGDRELNGNINATLDGKPITFRFEEQPLNSIVQDAGFRHLFATPGTGELRSCLAGGVAAFAYALSEGGAGYVPKQGIVRDLERSKRGLDSTLAIVCGKSAECRVRYPEDFTPTEEEGPVAIVMRRAD